MLAGEAGRPTDLAEVYREVLRSALPLEPRGFELSGARFAPARGPARRSDRRHAVPRASTHAASRHGSRIPAPERHPHGGRALARARGPLRSRRWGEAGTPRVKVEMLAEGRPRLRGRSSRTPSRRRATTSASSRSTRITRPPSVRSIACTRAPAKTASSPRCSSAELETAVGEESLGLKLRLARLQLDLHQPDEEAISHVEERPAREQVNDADAKALAERLLEVGSLRVRAARVLEVVYETRDEVRDLARVLATRLDADREGDARRDARALAPHCRLAQRAAARRFVRVRGVRPGLVPSSRATPRPAIG